MILFSLFTIILCMGCHNTNIEEYTRNLPVRLSKHPKTLKAIEHYQNKGEHQKLEALQFLLQNMDGHYAYKNVLSKTYDSILSSKEFGGEIPAVKDKNGLVLKRLIPLEKKYKKIKPTLTKIRYDMDLLDAKYLIENIDNAFKVWQEAPWAKELSFADFCETILPYRVDLEPMHHWRKTAYENFKWVIQTKSEIDRIQACSMINDSIQKVLSNMIEMSMYPERLTYDKMYRFKVGICEDETAFATMAMRGVGLPVGIDFVPQWPWRSMGHSWNYLLLEDTTSIPFMGTESNPGEPHFQHEKKGKVYRKTFAKQKESLAQIEKNHTDIPRFFRSPYRKDVTHLYTQTHDITVPLASNSTNTGKYVYLSVFDNQKWEPIDWTFREGKQTQFKNIEGGIVYLPVYYKEQRFISTEQPILVKENGAVKQLTPNFDKTQTFTLKRKYPLHKRMDDYLKNMIGGRFELSNDADFRNPIPLKTITQKPTPYLKNIKNDASNKKYKYIRYVSSKKDSGRCNLAIFNVYGLQGKKEIQLKGKIIGTEGSYKGYGAEKESAFDNDPSTFFDAPEQDWGKAWIGMELKYPMKISSIDFMPRNDTNTIFEGQEYELFYWDKGWKGMSKKTADASQQITFENVPAGALYLLHNHSGGKEERIFTWENGQVRWY